MDKFLWILISCLLAGSSAFANQNFPDIVVEAAAIEEDRIEPSRSASVVNAGELDQKKWQTVADALRTLPGVEVVRQGGVGQTTSIFIRGAGSEDSLVLIDGVEANDAMSPACGFDFSSLSPENIERIEVYHGPQSVRFGSGALGGVINIITKEGEHIPTFRYGVEGGAYGTFKSNIGASGKKEKFGYSIGAEAITTDGFSAAAKSGGEVDGAEVYSGSTKLTYDANSKAKIEFVARYNDADTEIDTQGGAAGDDPNNSTHAKQTIAGISASQRFFSDQLKSSIGFYYSEVDRRGRNRPDAANTTDSKDRFFSENIKVQSDHNLFIGDNHEVRLGLQWREETGSLDSVFAGTPTVIPEKSQHIMGEAVTYLYENQAWFYDLGGRLDQSSTTGEIQSYRISAGRFFNDRKTKSFFSYGTGFKLPSLYQLYSTYGDKSLQEENSKTWEVTVEQVLTERLSFTLTGFQNRYEELIDFNLNSFKYYNIAKARTQGVELESKFKPNSALELAARYTYLDTEDEATGLVLLRRPRNAWSASARYTHGKWQESLDYRFKGVRRDIDPVSFERVDNKAYDVVDFGISYLWSPHLKINLRTENLLDRSYEEVAGYGAAGFSAYAGVSGEL